MFPFSVRRHRSSARPSPLGLRFAEIRHTVAARLRARRNRARTRRELRELDDATLRDIGLSRAQANFYADRER